MNMANAGGSLQSEPLFDRGRAARPMGCGHPLDDGGSSLLPLFRFTDNVNHSIQGCSHGADADDASQQEHYLCEADVQRSISAVSDREDRMLLTSCNRHDDVRSMKHGARHPDAAWHIRPTQLRLGGRATSTMAVHTTKLPGGPITTDGMRDGRSVDDANPSTLRQNTTGRQSPTSQSLTGGN